MIRSIFPIVATGRRLLPRLNICTHKVQTNNITLSVAVLSENKRPSDVTRRTFSGTEDVLAEQLMKATSTERVVDLLQTHHKVMNNQHLIIVLETLFNYKREHNLKELSLEAPEFRGFCRRLQQRARYFDVDSVVNVLKFVSFLGVRTDSPLTQSYMQMLRHQVNDLTIQQVLYLDFLLSKQSSTPLGEALRIALPMVLENQIELQLDPDNLPELVRLVSFASKHNMSTKVLRKIVDAILSSKKPLDVLGAHDVLWACLKTPKLTAPFNTLFNKALSVCVTHINAVPISRLMTLVGVLTKKHVHYVDFWDAVCQRAVEESWPLMNVQTVICSLSSLSLVNLQLLDKYAELIEKNAEEVQNNPKISLHSLIMAFSLANYRPKTMETVLKIVLESTDKIKDFQIKSPELFVKFAINLAVLNCSSPIIFEEICHDTFVDVLVDKLKNDHRISAAARSYLLRDVLLLHQITPLFGYHFDFDAALKTEAMHILKDSNSQFPLQRALQKALGGPQYMQTGLFTKSGVLIDHLLVIRRGNYPVAFNGTPDDQESSSDSSHDIKFVEDVSIPEDAKKVAVLVQWHTNTACNIKRTTGPAQLPARILAYEGYLPVAVPLVVWEELPDHEKIPYIMREIKLNVDNQEAIEVAR